MPTPCANTAHACMSTRNNTCLHAEAHLAWALIAAGVGCSLCRTAAARALPMSTPPRGPVAAVAAADDDAVAADDAVVVLVAAVVVVWPRGLRDQPAGERQIRWTKDCAHKTQPQQ